MSEETNLLELTIFDTETTGLDPLTGDRVVELAALRIKGDQKVASFNMLINPGRPISAGAFAVNKITPEMLKDAPTISAVMPKFLEFIAGSGLCSYNAGFDLGFLNNELKLIGLPALSNVLILDVLTMARRLLPTLSRYPLWLVAQTLGIKTVQEHRAFSDVEMTWEVLNRLSVICQEKNIALASFYYRI